MERNNLISLAMSFSSFLIGRVEVRSIILFGSVAKGSFDRESDIDIFIETSRSDKEVRAALELFRKTEEYEKFRLAGIENEISVKCGRLDDWKGIKRAAISGGIVLYGRYAGKPQDLEHKSLFLLSVEGLPRSRKVKVWRKVYGYRQKAGSRIYLSKGLAEKKLGKGAFLSTIESSQALLSFFKSNKVKYSILDIWVER
jgi:predicted nucleotidyltransferase